MRTLPPPTTDEADLYDRLQSRRAAATALTLKTAREAVLAAYARYASGGVTDLVSVIADGNVAESLRSNYPVLRTGALRDDGALVLARSRICCLCGFRPVSELDHYLPKAVFPEYAAYTLNLVPACGVCNREKNEEYRTGSGAAAFIHAYLDELSETERFLRGRLIIDGAVVPSFELSRPSGLDEQTFGVMLRQFDRFELAALYAEEAIELLLEKYGAIAEYFHDGGAESVRHYLSRDAGSAEERYGINHWKPVALHAAAASQPFCAGGFTQLGGRGL
jgi:hypothetical protein